MSIERHRVEREWIAADTERGRLLAQWRAAKRIDDPEAVRFAEARYKEADERCQAIKAQLRILTGVDLAIIPRKRGAKRQISNLPTLTAEQILEARALLDWTISMLAHQSKISFTTARKAERVGTAHVRPAKITALRRTLEEAGVEFVAEGGNGPGVRLRTPVS